MFVVKPTNPSWLDQEAHNPTYETHKLTLCTKPMLPTNPCDLVAPTCKNSMFVVKPTNPSWPYQQTHNPTHETHKLILLI